MPWTARVAALHGALWGFDRWYRLWWYIWPTSMALLICGWIYLDKPAGVTSPSAQWAKPVPTAPATAPKVLPNWKQEKMTQCFSKSLPPATSTGACTELIITGLVKGRELAAVYTQRGFLEREKQPDQALSEYNDALKVQPDFADALTGRAWIRMTRREYDDAFADLNKAIDLLPAPASGIARFYRGFAFLKIQNYPRALTDLNEAQKYQPSNADIYLARGEVEQAQENYDLALRDFDEFSKRAPKDPRGLVWRSWVLETTGRTQEALAAMENALALEPGSDIARTERDRLRAKQDESTPGK